MSVHCGPNVVTDKLELYVDGNNEKSYSRFGSNKWGDISNKGHHFDMWGTLNKDSVSYILPGTITNYFSTEDFMLASEELSVEMWIYPELQNANDAFYNFTSDLMVVRHAMYDHSNIRLTGPVGSITTGIGIPNNTWSHVVRTSKRSSGVEMLYINGIQQFVGVLAPNVNFNPEGFVLLGQFMNTNGVLNPTNSFKGKLSIFKMYSKELSSAEIQQNYNAIKGRFDLT